jgi:hypothetical protein
MKKIIRITENDIARIVKRIINEGENDKRNLPSLGKMGKLTKMGIFGAIIVTVILNVDNVEITDKNGNDVDVNIGDTYVCRVSSIRQKSGGNSRSGGSVIYYMVNAEDTEGNMITFSYDNPNFIEGDTIKVKFGRPMADYFMKGASEVTKLRRK